jgi:predicted O-methyltransferase YrrM
LGNPSAEIQTIEACKETYLVAKENLKQFQNIQLINETFDVFLSQSSNIKYDFVFVDGHHDGEALLKYMESLKVVSHTDTIFLLDDIRWSDSMFAAWNKIVAENNYHLTIDLFRMGLVVPRPQQQKEHFVLKV